MKIKFLAILLVCSAVANAQSFLWGKQIGGSSNDEGYSIAVDAWGNVYTTGGFRGTVDFDPGPGTFNLSSPGNGWNIFISKLDGNGNFIWAKNIGGSFNDVGNCIKLDSLANIYITGYFNNTVDFDPGSGTSNMVSAGLSDIFVCKLDSGGNFILAKQLSGTNNEFGLSIAVDNSGNIYTTGELWGPVDFDPGSGTYTLTPAGLNDIFISKLDTAGNFIYAKRIGGAYNDEGRDIEVDALGYTYTTGEFRGTVDFDPGTGVFNLATGNNNVWQGFILKLDSSGNFVWAKHFYGQGSGSAPYSLALDTSANIYTTGYFAGTIDFDPGSGTFNITEIQGNEDIFVSKLDSSGNFVYAKRLAGQAASHGQCIAVDVSGNVYSTGYFDAPSDFDPGPGVYTVTPSPGATYEIYVSKLDTGGNFMYAGAIGSTANDIGYGITADASGNIYITGSFEGTADLDPGSSIFNATSAGLNEAFIVKLGNLTTTVNEQFTEPEVFIYPNPFNAYATIKFGTALIRAEIKVYNMLGENIRTITDFSGEEIKIYRNEMPTGVYFIHVAQSNAILATEKVIIID